MGELDGAAAERLAVALYDAGAVQFGAFRMKVHETQPDAPLSPIYLDLRVLRSMPDQMDVAIDAFRTMLGRASYDLIADIPIASSPFVAILSHLLRVPMVTPRQQKAYGLGRSVEGIYRPGQTVAVIDDLVTKAGSKVEAIRLLEGEGLVVRDLFVLVDREQGGAAQLATAGYTLHAAVDFSTLLTIYRDTGRISPDQYARVTAYLAAS
jgi:uridine monophosphate synthetase